MISERESAGYLVGETTHLLRVNAGIALAALCLMTILGTVGDHYPGSAGISGIASFFVTLAFQYEISRTLLVHYDLVDGRPSRRRLWALLGVNLISGLGIVLSLLIFILPGVYLIVRWSAAVPALIAEDSGVYESLGLSAEAVDGRFWHIFAAILVVWAPCLAGLIASDLVPEGETLIEGLVNNLSINLSLIAGWHLAVAIYAGRQDGGRLAEVFA
jgi:hypothetical protein